MWYVTTIDLDRALVLRDEIARGSWSFILRTKGHEKTRLIVRVRGDKPVSIGNKLFHYSFWEPAHFIMERKMLLTLKEKAEATAHRQFETPPNEELVVTC